MRVGRREVVGLLGRWSRGEVFVVLLGLARRARLRLVGSKMSTGRIVGAPNAKVCFAAEAKFLPRIERGNQATNGKTNHGCDGIESMFAIILGVLLINRSRILDLSSGIMTRQRKMNTNIALDASCRRRIAGSRRGRHNRQCPLLVLHLPVFPTLPTLPLHHLFHRSQLSRRGRCRR